MGEKCAQRQFLGLLGRSQNLFVILRIRNLSACTRTCVYTRARCANYAKLFKYFKIYINGGRGRGFVYVLRIFELIYARAGYLNICVYICAQVSLYTCVCIHA